VSKNNNIFIAEKKKNIKNKKQNLFLFTPLLCSNNIEQEKEVLMSQESKVKNLFAQYGIGNIKAKNIKYNGLITHHPKEEEKNMDTDKKQETNKKDSISSMEKKRKSPVKKYSKSKDQAPQEESYTYLTDFYQFNISFMNKKPCNQRKILIRHNSFEENNDEMGKEVVGIDTQSNNTSKRKKSINNLSTLHFEIISKEKTVHFEIKRPALQKIETKENIKEIGNLPLDIKIPIMKLFYGIEGINEIKTRTQLDMFNLLIPVDKKEYLNSHLYSSNIMGETEEKDNNLFPYGCKNTKYYDPSLHEKPLFLILEKMIYNNGKEINPEIRKIIYEILLNFQIVPNSANPINPVHSTKINTSEFTVKNPLTTNLITWAWKYIEELLQYESRKSSLANPISHDDNKKQWNNLREIYLNFIKDENRTLTIVLEHSHISLDILHFLQDLNKDHNFVFITNCNHSEMAFFNDMNNQRYLLEEKTIYIGQTYTCCGACNQTITLACREYCEDIRIINIAAKQYHKIQPTNNLIREIQSLVKHINTNKFLFSQDSIIKEMAAEINNEIKKEKNTPSQQEINNKIKNKLSDSHVFAKFLNFSNPQEQENFWSNHPVIAPALKSKISDVSFKEFLKSLLHLLNISNHPFNILENTAIEIVLNKAYPSGFLIKLILPMKISFDSMKNNYDKNDKSTFHNKND
jgi:hypothetical protein